ncbi:urate hydroxylase PuuD [Benzoatithermus flavus]|uniref:Urate hydroxylase PuuD n=1 Tax=Benzoatithermus flavus TaxID=3108223 RepID=A0ABU8XNB1_9PROT
MVEPVMWEWLSLGVRWLHVIAGIAWIGSSFYFVHLDSSLKPRPGLPEGAGGEAWQVHGGGFYHMVKYLVAPARMPEDLTWFKWEAYTTWLSGFALLVVVYYFSAELYLIDPAVLALPAWGAVLVSVVGLTLGWLVYDGLCKSPLGRNDAALFGVLFLYLLVLAYGFTHVFSGRGAYMQMGALTGTMMVANVFLIIIPNQRKVVADLIAGRQPDPALGAAAKQRSMHNSYLTLPVVFVMISNHYPLAFASRWNWLIFGLVLVVGAAIRHFFIVRHKGLPSPWWTWGVATAGMLAIVLLSAAGPAGAGSTAAAPADGPVSFAEAEEVVISRCSMCHAEEPAWEGVPVPPKGVMLDTPERIRLHARDIALQAVMTHAMPPGNLTEITPEERQVLAAWIASGAKAE